MPEGSALTKGSEIEGGDRFAPGAVVFNLFTVVSSIGSGGMGSVYKVHHNLLNVDMALKLLNKGTASEADFVRFQNEAKTLSKLSHANVARVYDFGVEDDTPYLTMDFIEGQTLQEYLDQHGTLSLTEFVVIFSQVCSGLAHAHSRNIIHRDLKPGNIILSEDDNQSIRAVIVDFGVAKLKEEMQRGYQTQAGAFIGSPLCCSPEQINGERVTEASDMYSLGCTMFEALTGKPPFCGESMLDTLTMHLQESPQLEKLPAEIPTKIREAVAMLLEKRPIDRKWSAKEFQQALDSGHLISELGEEGAIAVTIPPRLRRIEHNEATAARIRVNYDLPMEKAPKSGKKQLALVCGGIVFVSVAIFYGARDFIPKPQEILGPTIPVESSLVDDVIVHTGKVDPSGETDIIQRSVRDVLPPDTALDYEFQSAKDVFDAQKFSKASPMFADCLNKLGSKLQSGKTRRVDVLRNLAVCAYMSGKTKQFNEYFKSYIDSLPEEKRADYILRLAEVIVGFYAQSKNMDAAIGCYRKFVEFDETEKHPAAKAGLLRILGDFEWGKGNADAALKALNQALHIFQSNKLTENDQYVALLINLGLVEFASGRLELAKSHLEEADRLLPDDEQIGVSREERLLMTDAMSALANIEYRALNFDKARMYNQKGLRLAQKASQHDKAAGFEKFTKIIDDGESFLAKNPQLLKKKP